MGAFYFGNMKLNNINNEICRDMYCKYTKLINYKSQVESNEAKNSETPRSVCPFHFSGSKSFSNSIFIFDWDDTLMCTSFLSPMGTFEETEMKLDPSELEKINSIDESAYNLLFNTIILGDTYVVTNATTSWVYFSADKFYPKVNTLLKKIKILSARELYEDYFPKNNKQWKISAFLDIQHKYRRSTDINIICIGDSNIEMQAANALAAEFSSAYLKTIKLRESPKLEELNKQLNLIATNLKKIFEGKKNLTITVQKMKKKK